MPRCAPSLRSPFNPLVCLVALLVGLAQSAMALAETAPSATALQALEWREVGPYRGGRSAAVAGIPQQRDTYYFGATGGGVWKTTDGGVSWRNVSDGYFGGSIGAVAVSEWDPNVIYVGTGEKTVRGNVSPGNGMWKSVDAGDTWAPIGLEDSQHISRIRIHPRNPDVAYAAVMGHLFGPNTERGVFRTTDGGATWERVLYVNEDAGAVDLAMDPTNPRILYASFWRVRRTPYSLESGGPGSGMHKSVDGGDTWVDISNNEGLPEGTRGISGITVSPTNPKNLYAIIEAEEGGVFRSRDAGATWQRVNSDRDLRQRAWYYSRIFADPVDEEGVYVANVGFHYSKDGGKKFSTIPTPHSDNHDLWIDPADPLRMIEANDGGANVSYDRGVTWSIQANQPTAQFYRVATDNAFPYRLLAGQQDNTAVRVRSRSATGASIGVRDWEPTAGGESGHIAAKPDNPDIVVGGSYGGLLRLVDHRTGASRGIDVWPDNPMGWGAAELKHRFQWNYPITFSMHDPDALYVAANAVFRSEDLGQTWQQISPDLTRNDKSRMGKSGGPITKDDTSVEYYGTVFALAESPTDANVWWAGSDDGLLHLTRDGGETWRNVTPRRLPEWSMINSIDVDPFNPGGAYVAATRYKLDDFTPYLYHTSDWGKTWRRISDGLPDGHFTRVLRADPERQGLLYAGTERGLYYSLNNGDDWAPLQLNLPIVPITDLQVKQGDLIAATQGRGFWILDDLTVLREFDAAHEQSAHLYTPRPAYRLIAGDGAAKAPKAAGTNPAPGVTFFYSLPEKLPEDSSLSLSVFGPDSDTPIWRWTPADDAAESSEEEANTAVLSTDPGLNRYTWDLRYPGMERFDGLILWSDMKAGPRAIPGRYIAELEIGGERWRETFDVLPDPRATASPADYVAQFRFVSEARDLLSRTHEEIGRLRGLREQLQQVKQRLAKDEDADSPMASELSEINAEIYAIDGVITEVEETLYQTKNRSRQDPLNYPIRLNNKLTSVMRLVDGDDVRPTAAAQQVKAELSQAIESELAKLQSVWTTRLPALNRAIREAGIDLIVIEGVVSPAPDLPQQGG